MVGVGIGYYFWTTNYLKGEFLCRGAGNRTLPSCSQNKYTTDILHPDKEILKIHNL